MLRLPLVSIAAICDRLVIQLKVSADSLELNLNISSWLSPAIRDVLLFDVTACWWWVLYNFDYLKTACQWLSDAQMCCPHEFFLIESFTYCRGLRVLVAQAFTSLQLRPVLGNHCWAQAAIIEYHTCYWLMPHLGSTGQSRVWCRTMCPLGS